MFSEFKSISCFFSSDKSAKVSAERFRVNGSKYRQENHGKRKREYSKGSRDTLPDLFAQICSMEMFQATVRAKYSNNLDINLGIELFDIEVSDLEI